MSVPDITMGAIQDVLMNDGYDAAGEMSDGTPGRGMGIGIGMGMGM